MGINSSRAEQLSASLGAASDTIAEILEELERQLSVLSENWSGGASEGYAQASAQVASRLAAMNTILRQAEQNLVTIADRHREAESEVQTLWA
jgi:WXG100 family type VII secretion target